MKLYVTRFSDRIIIATLIIFSSMVMFLLAFFSVNLIMKVLFFSFCVIAPIIVIYDAFFRRVIIDEKGVRYISWSKKYEIKWEDINLVGISYFPHVGKPRGAMICFSTGGSRLPILFSGLMCDHFIFAAYKKEVEELIGEYWQGDVVGIENINSKKRK